MSERDRGTGQRRSPIRGVHIRGHPCIADAATRNDVPLPGKQEFRGSLVEDGVAAASMRLY